MVRTIWLKREPIFEDHGDMFRYDERRISVVSSPSRNRLALLGFVRNVDLNEPFDLETFN